MRSRFILCCFVFLCPLISWAQSCGLTDTLLMSTNASLSFPLNIDNYFNNNLGDPMQGLCGVEINFVHQFVENLELTLTSPSGQSVDLIGPNSDDQFNFTFGTQWLISFVPCGETASPDFPFNQQWDNEQAQNFINFNIYTGSYYPYNGCLEDINTGPVNGQWTVTINNNPSEYPGAITFFRLIFCDSRGVECCFTNAGEMQTDNILACEGDTILNVSPQVNFPGGMADTALYGFTYLLAQDSIFFDLDTLADFSNFPAGDYQVCGFSYLKEELDSLPLPNGQLTIDSIYNNLNSLEPWLCAYLAEDCLDITIASPPDTTFLFSTICIGDSVQVGDQYYKENGVFTSDLAGYAGCDSVVVLDLAVQETLMTQLDSTICLGDSVMVGSSIYYTTDVYRDTLSSAALSCDSIVTLNLTVLDPVIEILHPVICDGDNFMVGDSLFSTSGMYEILLTSTAGCDSIVQVNLAVFSPEAIISPPDTINCYNNGILLEGINSTPSGELSFAWHNLDGLLLGDQSTLATDSSGTYILTVSQTNNSLICSNSDTVQVMDHRFLPIADAGLSDTLNCAVLEVPVGGIGSSDGPNIEYNWRTTNGNFTGTTDTPFSTVDMAGDYQLIVIDLTNGCQDTSSVNIAVDRIDPVADAGLPDTLTCYDNVLELGGPMTSQGPSFSYQWLQNDQEIADANGDSLIVTTPGVYELAVLHTNNFCTDTSTVQILIDTLRLALSIETPAPLNCNLTEVTLLGMFLPEDATAHIEWTASNGGLLGGDINSLTPQALSAGFYRFNVVNLDNGCVNKIETIVTDISTTIEAMPALPDTITCAMPTVSLFAGNSTQGTNIVYQWHSDNGQFVNDSIGETVAVNEAGIYQLIVQDTLTFCADTAVVEVFENRVFPLIDAGPNGLLNCAELTDTLNGTITNSGDFSINWTGDCILSGQEELNAVVDCPGWFYFEVTDTENSCTSIDSTEVIQNILPPESIIEIPDIITCFSPEITLLGSNSLPIGQIDFLWTGPSILTNNTVSQVDINEAGEYYLMTIRQDNFCADTTSITVLADQIAPIADAGPDTVLNCYFPTIVLGSPNTSQGSSFVYQWYESEQIITGETTDTLLINDGGNYTLTVFNQDNGCRDTASVVVIEDFVQPSIVDPGENMDISCLNPTATFAGDSTLYNQPVFPMWSGPCIIGDTDQWSISADCEGFYVLTVSFESNGCSRSDSAEIVLLDDIANASLPDSLHRSCETGEVTISTEGSSQGFYTWYLDQEEISLPFPNPVVSQSGIYELVVENFAMSCMDTAAVQVLIDCPIETIIATPDTLNCYQNIVALDGSNSLSEGPVAYEWLLPQTGCALGPIDQNQIDVVCPGDYALISTQLITGQSDTAWVNVLIDTIRPIAIAGLNDTITCTHPTAILNGDLSSIGPAFTYAWTNTAEDTLSQSLTLNTMNAGTYFFTVLDTLNGCTNTDIAQVLLNNTTPVIGFGSGVFPCGVDSFGLQAFVNPVSENDVYAWQGAGVVDNADSLTVWVNTIGNYIFSIENTQTGCTAMDSIMVTEQICEPCLDPLPFGELSCLVDSVSLEAQYCLPCDGCLLDWQFNNSPILNASNLSLNVGQAGTYILTATDTLGFTNEAVFEVILLDQTPIVDIGPDIFITCDSLSVTLGTSTTSTGLEYQYEWFNRAGIPLIGSTPYFETAIPDTFILQVTNTLSACFALDTAIVLVDTLYPIANAGMDEELTCDDNFVILNGGGSTINNVSYQWVGPQDDCVQGENTINPIASCAGTYVLHVIGNNGCVATDTVEVITNNTFPEIIPFPDTSLTCASPEITLIGGPPIGDEYDYRWCELNELGEELSFSCAFDLNYPVSSAGTYRFAVLNTMTGCESYNVVEVVWDTLPPVVNAGMTDTLFCTLDSLQLHGDVSNGALFSWSSAQNLPIGNSNTLSPYIYNAGWYVLIATDPVNGCEAVDSVLIAQDEEVPTLSISPAENLDCQTPTTMLTAQANTLSNQIQWQWASPQGTFLGATDQPTVSVNDTAWYFLQVTDPVNSCTATDSVLVSGNYDAPTAAIFGLDTLNITCAADTLLLDASISSASSGALLTYNWQAFGPGQLFPDLNSSQVFTDRPADYLLMVEDQNNGCIDSLAFNIGLDIAPPTIVLQIADTLDCLQPEIWITAEGSSQGSEFMYEWFNSSMQSISVEDSLLVNEPGNYQLVITDIENGCTADQMIAAAGSFLRPAVQMETPANIECLQAVVVLDGSNSAQGSQYVYTWTAMNGGLLLGNADDLIDSTNAAGTYLLTILDTTNGCDSSALVTVVSNGTPITGFDAIVESPPCFGDLYGQISIENVTGGTMPFIYSINEEAPSINPFFEDLPIGNYDIFVSDGLGCTFSETVQLLPAEELIIDIGPDIEITLGETATVEALINSPVYDTLIWWPTDLVSMPGATIQKMSPQEMRHVIATVINENGCVARDTMRIFVVKDYSIFIPTAFSPNGDGNNDNFTVFGGDEVVEVATLRIFDRWGTMVFERNDFQPNDPSLGWDGTFDGQNLNPQVFVYYLEVSFIDGTSQVISGDVILMD